MPAPNLASTERTKLVATLLNTLAAGLITVGYFAPLSQLLTTPTPLSDDRVKLLVAAAVVCTFAAAALHSIAQWTLAAKLKDTDDQQ